MTTRYLFINQHEGITTSFLRKPVTTAVLKQVALKEQSLEYVTYSEPSLFVVVNLHQYVPNILQHVWNLLHFVLNFLQ